MNTTKTPESAPSPAFASARARIGDGTAHIGVIGLGYVGLPLAAASAAAGFRTLGFDIDATKIPKLNAGQSYIDAVPGEDLKAHVDRGLFQATSDMSRLGECDFVLICVPTPLTQQREPDLSYVVSTVEEIARTLRPGQTVVLESTTWPGTTSLVVKPILERGGLKSGVDFFVGFSPEREDPGNINFKTTTIPKIVSGDGPQALELVHSFYARLIKSVVPVSTPDTAEAVKITENIFRAVNIALVNELKVVYDAMGIDIWEVVEAAKTKPFGYMPFYPGPGLGGHCIPIDPFYLTWRAREFDISTRFIELAGEVNRAMPAYVVRRLEEALDRHAGKSLGRSRILVCGLAYKKNVSDIRESPAFKIMELLGHRGVAFDYHDPHVPEIPPTREHAEFTGRKSAVLNEETLQNYDAVLIVTDHDATDYAMIDRHARLIVDTRNAMRARAATGGAIVEKA